MANVQTLPEPTSELLTEIHSIVDEVKEISADNLEWEVIEEPLNIVIRGVYIWVSGDTKQVRNQLKELGFKWARTKEEWFWKPASVAGGKWGRRREEETVETIESKYGSVVVQGKSANPGSQL